MSCENGTPLYNINIDTSTSQTVNQGCLEVLSRVRPTWPSSEVQLKVFTDGLTNKLVGGWHEDKRDMVLVRIYGEDTEKFIDRDSEKENMKKMEESGCGSKLYAAFKNGLSYEFVHGKTLQLEMLFDPKVYREVAKSVAMLHKIKIEAKSVGMWSFLEKLIKLYPDHFTDAKKVNFFSTYA